MVALFDTLISYGTYEFLAQIAGISFFKGKPCFDLFGPIIKENVYPGNRLPQKLLCCASRREVAWVPGNLRLPAPCRLAKKRPRLPHRQPSPINLDPIFLGENYGSEKPGELTFSLDTNTALEDGYFSPQVT